MRLRNFAGTFAILAASMLAGPVVAHPRLDSASPAADVSVVASPKEIQLDFSEAIIAKFSGLDLKDESGRAVATGDPVIDTKDPKHLIVPVSAPLAPGRYTVNWHAVSEDTHKVSGDYSFRVIAESTAPQVKSEGAGGGSGEPAKRPTKDEAGNKECSCKDSERTDRVRERSRDGDRDLDRRDRYDRDFENRDGFRDRDTAGRNGSRSRPDCVVDDDGYKYCRVR